MKNLIQHFDMNPHFLAAAGWMIGEKNRICSWDGLDELRKKVAQFANRPGSTQSVNSFILLSNYDDPAKFLEWSRINARENFANLGMQNAPAKGNGRKHDRIRVGYFSVDFRNHPVAHLTAPSMDCMTEKSLRYGFIRTDQMISHPVRQRIQNGAEHFINLEGCSIQGMVERIRVMRLIFWSICRAILVAQKYK